MLVGPADQLDVVTVRRGGRDGRSDRRMIVDDDEADHRSRVAGRSGPAKPMDSLNVRR
jgi:hypothetical protein